MIMKGDISSIFWEVYPALEIASHIFSAVYWYNPIEVICLSVYKYEIFPIELFFLTDEVSGSDPKTCCFPILLMTNSLSCG